MKKLTALAMALLLVLGLGACGTVQSLIAGDVTGEVGKTYRTEWFDFSVDELVTNDTYGGETAPDGYTFVVATVTEKNTWDDNAALPMGTFDFYMDAGGSQIDAEYPWTEEMMPEEFMLDVDETVTYDVVFLVPTGVTEVSFVYVEIDEEGSTHATFTIKHTL